MLKELLDRVVELGRKSAEIRWLESFDPRVALYDHGGELVERVIQPGIRKHSVRTLEDLIAAAKSPAATQPAIFHDETEVALLLDFDDRRDVVTFALTPSEPLKSLEAIAAENGIGMYQPKQLWRMLRTTFADCEVDPALVKNLQRLRWRAGQETRAEFSQGRESIGKDIEAELQSDFPFPDSIVLEVRLYEDLGEDDKWPVRCVFDVDAIEQQIHFGPYAGELSRAAQLHQGTIRQRLEQSLKDVPIYYGSP